MFIDVCVCLCMYLCVFVSDLLYKDYQGDHKFTITTYTSTGVVSLSLSLGARARVFMFLYLFGCHKLGIQQVDDKIEEKKFEIECDTRTIYFGSFVLIKNKKIKRFISVPSI